MTSLASRLPEIQLFLLRDQSRFTSSLFAGQLKRTLQTIRRIYQRVSRHRGISRKAVEHVMRTFALQRGSGEWKDTRYTMSVMVNAVNGIFHRQLQPVRNPSAVTVRCIRPTHSQHEEPYLWVDLSPRSWVRIFLDTGQCSRLVCVSSGTTSGYISGHSTWSYKRTFPEPGDDAYNVSTHHPFLTETRRSSTPQPGVSPEAPCLMATSRALLKLRNAAYPETGFHLRSRTSLHDSVLAVDQMLGNLVIRRLTSHLCLIQSLETRRLVYHIRSSFTQRPVPH